MNFKNGAVLATGIAMALPLASADAADIAIIGPDGTKCYPSVQATLQGAGHVVDVYPDLAALDTLDLCGYEIVWMASGISSTNEFCPGETIPNSAGEDNLRDFILGGGAVLFLGENGQPNQQLFLDWRDAFLATLGSGGFDGSCQNCDLGTVIHLDPAYDISTVPNVTDTVGATTAFTGGIVDVGHSTPFAWPNPEFTGIPVASFFDYGDLELAPMSRIVVFNNTNNTASFVGWTPNIVAFLEGNGSTFCPPDIVPNCAVDTDDLLSLLANWGACTNCPQDIDNSGAVDVSDLLALLAAWGPCVR